MNDRTTNADDAQTTGPSQRDSMIEGAAPGGGALRTIGMVVLLTGVGIGAYFLLLQDGPDTTGPETSQSADIQNPEGTAGVDTNMLGGNEVETVEDTPVQAVMLPADPVETDTGDADRIAQLERELDAMRAAQGDAPDLAALLQEEREANEAAFARERAEAEERYRLQLAEMARNMTSGDTGMSDEERDARARLEAERQRRAAIAEAQIMSDGIVIDGSSARGGSRSQDGAGSQAGDGSGGGSQGGAGGGRSLSSNEQFMAQASTQSYDTVQATRIAAPDRTIVQGTTLNAVLETAISTELPGVIRAVVTDDVMSYDATNVLLPRGTRLIGSYNSDVSIVQGRVQMAWNRAVTPEGVSVELGGYGSDALGGSGQAGSVDARFRQRFGSAALISLIGAGPEVVINENSGGAASDAAEDVGDDVAAASQGALGDYLKAGQVIYIDQGTYMTVFVNRDLVL